MMQCVYVCDRYIEITYISMYDASLLLMEVNATRPISPRLRLKEWLLLELNQDLRKLDLPLCDSIHAWADGTSS